MREENKNYWKTQFCELWNEVVTDMEIEEDSCITCPFTERCYKDHNGFLDYIDEVEESR